MSRITVLTLFPSVVEAYFSDGVVGRLLKGERGDSPFEFQVVDLRGYGIGRYRSVDDTCYGGRPGMVLRADVLKAAIDDLSGGEERPYVIYTAPRGRVWGHEAATSMAQELAQRQHTVFICGRYEGIDERFLESYVDEFWSLGDFVLSGGELAVMAMIDSALRFMPGALGNKGSIQDAFMNDGLLAAPVYTRPAEFEGVSVPEVVASGHHARIEEFEREQRTELTRRHRPDLLRK